MTTFNLYLFLLAGLTACLCYWLHRSPRINAPSRVIEDSGETIVLRQSLLARAIKLNGKPVKKSEVVKLQKSDGCLSVFLKSDNAHDIWVSEKRLAEVIDHAKNLLPHAEYFEIKR